MAPMKPLFVLHLRLEAIGVIPWSVFSFDALERLKRDIDAGELGAASILELEDKQLQEAA